MEDAVGRTRLIAFPGKAILTAAEAARTLRLSPTLLTVLRALHCGPRSVSINGRRLYTREEILGWKRGLLAEFGIGEHDLTYRLLPPRPEVAAGPDPLLTLLCRRLVRRRLTLTILWTMLLVGVVMSLTLF